ncbi:hypothetical protein PHLGIDRAFT_113553 [Phlebiopsis gigantea 11061_1 CR5-6]|uniref:Ribosome biogenesis protein SLX9 n=1 Tax=Phlebiopsis gigantea (strain 11061_1 CR5-6) TaxID=745531 RepID=A0A0C3PWQ2_PHLG1|nr:hypothetical protein PHLGIDRAFT_113553 [Phlebiopsis gigantea 11061_1 CR5-6]
METLGQAPLKGSTVAETAAVTDNMEAPALETPTGSIHEPMKKKEKQSLKHERFLQKLEASRAPYSKSHGRRLKRRAKEQVANGLDEIKAAISAVEMGDPSAGADAIPSSAAQPAQRARLAPGQIGEGKHVPLSKAQRKRALAAERLRVPMILSSPEFSSNPFETIRKHAQNTLVKHEVPK